LASTSDVFATDDVAHTDPSRVAVSQACLRKCWTAPTQATKIRNRNRRYVFFRYSELAAGTVLLIFGLSQRDVRAARVNCLSL
jgi:hypothetical protein